MTPEQRAAEIVQNYHAKRAWGYDPNQHAEYEAAIAAAIRDAVAEEREECAKLAYIPGSPDDVAEYISEGIRARGTP